MKGFFCLLSYIYKIAERFWYVVKHVGMENMLTGGGGNKERKRLESLTAKGWHKSARKQVHSLTSLPVLKI